VIHSLIHPLVNHPSSIRPGLRPADHAALQLPLSSQTQKLSLESVLMATVVVA